MKNRKYTAIRYQAVEPESDLLRNRGCASSVMMLLHMKDV